MGIEEILKSNEAKTLEFKEGLDSPNNIIKTIIAFANTAGGVIVIGVEDKTKKVVGVKNPLLEEERLTNIIHASIEPMLMPDVEIQAYKKKELIIINVPHATGPYFLKAKGLEKGTYVRLGSTNRQADRETIQALQNFARNIYFDELPDLQGKAADLDWDVIKELFRQEGKNITKEIAHSLGLLTKHGTKEVPSLGGVILFGVNRLKQFPEAIIRCARFLGYERVDIHDQVDIEIYLPLALDEAIKFIQRNTRQSSIIKDLKRIDTPEYPLLALREAIINAIVHADYAMKGVYISIAIFDDRIEITNPGSLPFGFTIEKALAGSSRIRNRVIAKVFHQLKWIEQWGRGLTSIVRECEKRGLEKPKFEELNNQFRVTLYGVKKQGAKKPKATRSDQWQKDLLKELSARRKLDAAYVITTKEAAEYWNITTRAALNRLKKMVSASELKRTSTSSSDPQTKYILNK